MFTLHQDGTAISQVKTLCCTMRYTWALWTLHHPLVGAQVPSAAGLGFGLSF